MHLDGRVSAQDPHEPPERDQRPDSFQKEESPLLLLPGEQRENGGADQSEDQVSPARWFRAPNCAAAHANRMSRAPMT